MAEIACLSEKQEVTAIGKKLGVKVACFTAGLVEFRQGLRLTAQRADALQRVVRHGKYDGVIRAPRSFAPGALNAANGLWRASGRVDSFQLVLCEEGDVPAIRRPEWLLSAFGAVERLRCVGIQRPEEQPIL